MTHPYYEFFAGGGMARAGLGASWRCVFADDVDSKKAASYAANWGSGEFLVEDIVKVTPADLPGVAMLAWASFPCQDLSLAGAGAGLKGERSGTFWPFWKLMVGLAADERAPRLVVLENVSGALSSHGGRDFAAIGTALTEGGYRFGAMMIDGAHFVPQSRPRLFVVAAHHSLSIPDSLFANSPDTHWHTPALSTAYGKLSPQSQAAWLWWRLPLPPIRNVTLNDIVESEPKSVKWHTPQETRRLLAMMSPINYAKVVEAKKAGRRIVGGVYKRTRLDEDGRKVQRAEVRFDNMAGCLRTPAGGSSRQTIMIVEANTIRSRLVSAREAARLMGLPDDYVLPENYNEAYHLAGDGVVVPVVRHLAKHLLEPIAAAPNCLTKVAA
jgi:DNA (cytosine-5)-methyltransferase 1